MNRLNRRTLLRGAGGVSVALPMLEAMLPRRAHAATAPRRFVIFFSPNGSNNLEEFNPREVGTSFSLGKETAPLAALKDDLLVLSGIDNVTALGLGGEQHAVGMSQMLTCTKGVLPPGEKPTGLYHPVAGAASIDQVIAPMVRGSAPFASLELGVQTALGSPEPAMSRMISKGPMQLVPPIDDPREAWKLLFSGTSSGPATGEASKTMDVLRAQRRSVLDLVKGDAARLAARLGAVDRVRIERHLATIRELEQRLGGAATPAPTTCARPAEPMALDARNPEHFPAIGRLQMDLLVLALACDLTRVASLQWSSARSDIALPWINFPDSHHEVSHGQGSPLFSTINTWYAEQLAYLGKAMKAVREADGTLLGNSVVWWCSEVSYGRTHKFTNVRAFLLGQCGGYFTTGRHVALRNAPLNQLMVSFQRAMGNANAMRFGDPSVPAGPLPGFA